MNKICLIGESDPFIARLLRRFSEESGLDPIQARLGQEVLRRAQQQAPELVIIDPELPGTLRGWEAVQALRQEPALLGTPVIACSWLQADAVAALVGTVDGHLQKPEIRYHDFLMALRAIGLVPAPPPTKKETQHEQ